MTDLRTYFEGYDAAKLEAADELSALRERVEALEGALRKIAENDCDGLHSYAPQAMQSIARTILAQQGGEGGWQLIDEYPPHQPVLVSRPYDGYQRYRPTTAFLDATGVWRVFRSEGGNAPLPFDPTHWRPTPPEPIAPAA